MSCRNSTRLSFPNANFRSILMGLLAASLLLPGSTFGFQSDKESDDLETSLKQVLDGHSLHGEAFNEGPRQKAYLMGGTGNIHFPVTTVSEEAQAFIDQGIGQIHGFWYLEAERSFRQAAAIDPDCAMAYWGAAMATSSTRERAQGFIKKSVEAKERLKDKITKREKLYIDALEKYFSDKEKDKSKRAQSYLKDLESILIEFPDDIEAKALVAHRIWHNAREGIPVSSYVATSSLIDEILKVEPLHPAHHYTIHLWDHRHPKNAVQSAARCGVSAPTIAHMWHMPGHIYSRLKRYEDAVYQQEASARVDHAHMMRDRVMPDEISNFAHNNEWLIRNLIFIGRAHDAVDLAKNMLELPQHPKYNTLEKKGGSASYGRRRLLQVLREYQLFEEAINCCQSASLAITNDNVVEQIKTLRLMACSGAMVDKDTLEYAKKELKSLHQADLDEQTELKGKIDRIAKALDKKLANKDVAQLSSVLDKVDPKKGKIVAKKLNKDLGELKKRIKLFDKANLAVEGYELAANGDYKEAFEKLEKATGEDVSWLGELEFLGGDTDKGLKKVEKQVDRRPQEVLPLARLAYLQYQNGDTELAKASFEKLRDTSSSMDMDLEIFQRLSPLASELALDTNWQKKRKRAADLGFQPPLASLGPFRWSPTQAPTWTLTDARDKSVGTSDFDGQPVVVIFYLGHACLHCAEQLHAFAPRVAAYEKAGIKMIAISSDDQDGLQQSINDFDGVMPIRLASDGTKEIFKKFRAYDDFEDQPLHGTFLIDGQGKIRWQDISYEPFMDHQFLLDEAKRLLGPELSELVNQKSETKKVSQK